MNSLKAFFLAAMLGLSVSVASAQSMDDAFVEKHLGDLSRSTDLSRYVL